MAMMNQLRSPLPWQCGKHYSAQFILSQLPTSSQYGIFVDVFGGGANILLNKAVSSHLEIYNDINDDLVNCWMHLRDEPAQMQERLQSLPYARSLYYAYHKSLVDGTLLDPLERAVRWFYVLRSSFRAEVSAFPNGWNGSVKDKLTLSAKTYRNLDFHAIAERFQHVNIDCRDFEAVIKQYQQVEDLRTLLYCDPPYINSEHYYKPSKDANYTAFHQRLACVLNETPALVTLSYYEHPWLDELYPAEKWRRVRFETIKHSQRTKPTRDKAPELLLTNYAPANVTKSLWDAEVAI